MVQDLIEEIVSDEDVLSHTSDSPRMPFRFRVTIRLPSEGWCPLSIGETAQLPPKTKDIIVHRYRSSIITVLLGKYASSLTMSSYLQYLAKM